MKVFYVDFGNKEFVADTSIRNIDPQFLHLPFQALECFLVDIEPVGGKDRFTQEAKYVHVYSGASLIWTLWFPGQLI
jgi:hypothetical protein